LAGGNVAIRIKEPTDYGIIVSGVQVVEACLGIVVITTVGEGVVFCEYRIGSANIIITYFGKQVKRSAYGSIYKL